MKYIFWAVQLFVIVLLQCVNDPVVIKRQSHKPKKAITITQDDFNFFVTVKKYAVIEFYSEYCSVCSDFMWVIDSLSDGYGDSALIGANNAEEDSLWKQFNCTVPSFLFFKDGSLITRRSYIEYNSSAYDTLDSLVKALLSGKLKPDTPDTIKPIDTTSINYLKLDITNFDTTVYRQGRVVMVFFMIPNGAACIHMEAIIKTFAPNYKNRAIIAKVQSDQISIWQRYGLSKFPAYRFFKDSVEVIAERKDGILPAETLTGTLERLLAK